MTIPNQLKAKILFVVLTVCGGAMIATLGFRQIGTNPVKAQPENAVMTTTGVISPSGGELSFGGGTIKMVFPPQAVAETVAVRWAALDHPMISDQPITIFYAFSLDARALGEGTSVSAFARPVTLSLHYTPQQIGNLTEEHLALFYRDPANGKWRRATSQVDTDEHVIRAPVAHLSEWGGGLDTV